MTDRREVLHFDSDDEWLAARALDVTSTESSALWNLCPYFTAFELHHRKLLKTAVSIEDTQRMKWGRRNQRTVADGIAEDMAWNIRALNAYVRLPELRMGASFDYEIVSHPKGPGIFEVKNVDRLVYRDQWTEDEAPPHIELQLQHQLEVMDRDWGAIGVLVGGNEAHVIERERDRQIGMALRLKIDAFWKAVDAGIAPAPDFSVDAAFIGKLYGYAEPGKVLDAHGDAEIAKLCAAYKSAAAAEKIAATDKDAAHAAILMRMGDSERLLADGYTVTAGLIAEAPISYIRKAYRGFRFTKLKEAASGK